MAYLVLQVVVMGEGVQEEMMCQGRSVLFIRLVLGCRNILDSTESDEVVVR